MIDQLVVSVLLTALVGTLLVGSIFIPSLQGLRELLTSISLVHVPVRDALAEGAGLAEILTDEELEKRLIKARGDLSRLYRSYQIAFAYFSKLWRVVLYLVGGALGLSLAAGQGSIRRVLLHLGLLMLLILVSLHLKPEIAPKPGEVFGVDYIGRYFTHLHINALFQAAHAVLVVVERSSEYQFVLVLSAPMTGMRCALAVEADGERVWSTTGAIDDSSFRMVVRPSHIEYEIPLGSYGAATDAPPEQRLKYRFWLFAPEPISWTANELSPVYSEETFKWFEHGRPCVLQGPYPYLSLGRTDAEVKFSRRRRFGLARWEIVSVPESLRELIQQVPKAKRIDASKVKL